ncbi:MAG: PDZ domain-containing protein [Pirellulales bacterium]
MQVPRINGSVAVAAVVTAGFYLTGTVAWAEDVIVRRLDDGKTLLVAVDGESTVDGEDVVVGEDTEVPNDVQEEIVIGSEADKAPSRWIGVQLGTLSEVVRAQLDLSDNVGVVVAKVFPDSPADEAGIKPFDIIVSVGDRLVRKPQDLAAIVAGAGDGELTLKLLRKGGVVDVTVTPSETQDVVVFAPDPAREAESKVRKMLRVLTTPNGDVEYRVVRPGIVLGHPSDADSQLPEGWRIRIDREGGKPAQITIDRGEEHWEVSEQRLDRLPDDVRKQVQRLLSGPIGVQHFRFDAPVANRLRWQQAHPDHNSNSNNDEGSDVDGNVVEEREEIWRELDDTSPLPEEFNLDRTMKQIESLRKQFEQLADEQAEKTEQLVEERSDELEEMLTERVDRLEELLTKKADQLRTLIETFFSDVESPQAKQPADAETEDGAPSDGDSQATPQTEGDDVDDGDVDSDSEGNDDAGADVEIELDLEPAGGEAV